MTPLTLLVLAQEGVPAPKAPTASPLLFILPILLVFVIYFMMLRPQKKKEQRRKQMIADLQRGDQVVTIGGIHGEVISVKENHVILLVDAGRGATLKMLRNAIHRIQQDDSDEDQRK